MRLYPLLVYVAIVWTKVGTLLGDQFVGMIRGPGPVPQCEPLTRALTSYRAVFRVQGNEGSGRSPMHR